MKDGPGANVSSAFDEHERDTAKRAYPKEIVREARVEAQTTRRIPKSDLEAVLRNESGTRPAVSRDEIERFTRERLRAAEAGASEFDPHARPTIDATPPFLLPVPEVRPALGELAPRETAPLVATARATPAEFALSAPPASRPQPGLAKKRTPAWVVALLVFGVMALFAAWTTLGFFLGRAFPR